MRAAWSPFRTSMQVRMVQSAAMSLRAQLNPPSPDREKPTSPTYYTTKPSFMDTLQMLDKLTREIKRELEQAYILAPNARPPPMPQGAAVAWVSRERLSGLLGLPLRNAQYSNITSRLSLLLRYRDLALKHFSGQSPLGARITTQQREIVQQIVEVLDSFTSEHTREKQTQGEASDFVGSSARGKIDDQGRAYARGRRKESSARVWLVQTKPQQDGTLPIGQILVNNVPMSEYFLRTAHREAVTWPLKLAGLLGAYNVFAIVRGGGASGQAGALAHGIANALVASLGAAEGEHAKETRDRVRQVLVKDGVLNRDPRMVERKKPGLAKARKAWTWVKR